MKKFRDMKPGAKKQMLSGMVYVALAVTVVAVTISTVTSTFFTSEKNAVSGGETDIYEGNYQLKLPETDINFEDFNLDSPVSDAPQGIDATVTELEVIPENGTASDVVPEITEELVNKPQTDISLPKPPSDADTPEKNNEEVPKMEEQSLLPDRTKPVSEEPYEKVFEMGFDGYIKPCSGYVTKEFAMEVPVYSATMYDYRTHAGIDIACDIGTPVKAVTNGVISDIYEDYMFGTTIVMEHKDGIKSVYSNLSPDLPAGITVGKAVVTGEAIAGVGQSALCESAEVSHLHFEMTKDGVPVNPEDYFTVRN